MEILFILIIAYFIGSIPFGLVLTRLFSKQDIRSIGSGNIGATNVLRTGNKALALATLLFDSLKGLVMVVVLKHLHPAQVSFLGPDVSQFELESALNTLFLLAGFAAILGHCFPIWLKFKGGKGVATALGVLLAAVPLVGLVAVTTWGVVAGFFRYSSLAALCAVAIAPLATLLIYGAAPAVVTVLIALLVFWRHRENIQRLLKGDEPRIGQKS